MQSFAGFSVTEGNLKIGNAAVEKPMSENEWEPWDGVGRWREAVP